MSEKECPTCGRDDGHWIGCAEVSAARPLQVSTKDEVMESSASIDDSVLPMSDEPAAKPDTACEYGDCTNDKRPQGQGPKPKYCEDHSTQKSRK